MYVDDVVKAILAVVASQGVVGQDMLIASGRAVSVGTLMRRVAGITGARTEGLREDPDRCGDRLYASARRAETLLGWTPKVDLDEGLARTVAWWRTQADPAAGSWP